MAELERKANTAEYERDFAAWADDQARILRDHKSGQLDWENLAEEIGALSGREKAEIRSRLIVLLVHLLKWEFQPDKRGHSWQSTIGAQRIHVEGVLEYSPSLKRFPATVFQDCYARARKEAARQTRLPLKTFPADARYSIKQILDHEFMPGRPWSPADLS
jgi:hypothetical protein